MFPEEKVLLGESAPRRKVAEETIIGYGLFIQAPERSIQAQMVLAVAPEDTVSGSKRSSMVMIYVALRKQPRATARGKF